MHGRNIRFEQDLNQGPRTPKANTITTELKRVLPNIIVKYCISNQKAAMLEGLVSHNM